MNKLRTISASAEELNRKFSV